MSKDVEFLKGEVARLRLEQTFDIPPIRKLAIEKDIEEAEILIAALEGRPPPVEQKSVGPKSEISIVKNSTGSPTLEKTNAPHEWHNMPLGKIAIGVVTAVLAAFSIYLIAQHFGIPL